MKKGAWLILGVLLLCLAGCRDAGSGVKIGYYRSENQMSLLEIEENDAFVFARCLMMSYAPTGNYAVDNGKLTFRDTQGRAYDFTFDLQDGNLIYRGEAIEDFLRDGDVFTYCGTDCPEQTATI